MNWDQPLMMALLPYLMVEVAGQGGEGLDLVVQEISAVMQVGSVSLCQSSLRCVRHIYIGGRRI
jgi:hypothetical protein